jgi:hypothetical protein
MIQARQPIPGLFLIDGFAETTLGIDPNTFIPKLDSKVPSRGAEDQIVPGQLQWVTGANKNLMYRGNELKRRKIWAQRGPVEEGVRVYSYTGFTWPVANATSNWEDSEDLRSASEKMNEFIASWDSHAPPMDHLIVTAYDDESHGIGFHFDKIRSLAAESWIAIVKLGPVSRRFAVRERAADGEDQEKMPVRFDEVVNAGTLILMDLKTNLATQHAVPEVAGEQLGLSGSIVWRAVKNVVSQQELAKKVETTERGRDKREEEKKRKRENA